MKKLLWLCLVMIVLASCEKVIDLTPESRESLLVVDGFIEDGEPPMILLSRSINYFSSITPDKLVSSLVKGASLTLNDGSRTVSLKEYSIALLPGYDLVYYSTDTTNAAVDMRGEQEKSYTLQVIVDQKNYTAVTTIPKLTKTIDSLWWVNIPFLDDTTRVRLMAKVTDPPGLGNYIRYWTRVGNEAFKPGDNSVYDDQIVDGTTYDIPLEQGKDRNNAESHRRSFGRGDTVTVKLANIDKATFDFYRTLEFGYQSVGNPFSSPVKVLGNVSNGALGAFSGYAVQYTSLIIPQ